MASIDKRLDDLERDLAPEPQLIHVDWESDGLVLDQASGERVLPSEWKRRHPGEQLVILEWEDVLDD